jgi:hypothetical protein
MNCSAKRCRFGIHLSFYPDRVLMSESPLRREPCPFYTPYRSSQLTRSQVESAGQLSRAKVIAPATVAPPPIAVQYGPSSDRNLAKRISARGRRRHGQPRRRSVRSLERRSGRVLVDVLVYGVGQAVDLGCHHHGHQRSFLGGVAVSVRG